MRFRFIEVVTLSQLLIACSLPGVYQSTGGVVSDAPAHQYQLVINHSDTATVGRTGDMLRMYGYRELRGSPEEAGQLFKRYDVKIDEGTILILECNYAGQKQKDLLSTSALVDCSARDYQSLKTYFNGTGEYMGLSQTDDIRGAVESALIHLPVAHPSDPSLIGNPIFLNYAVAHSFPTPHPKASPPRVLSAPSGSSHTYGFSGYTSGHDAGYEWAEEHGIDDPDDCGGNSDSFIEGCQNYAEEQEADDEEDE